MRPVFAFLAVALLGACHSLPEPATHFASAYRPLEARIVPPMGGQLSFTTNRPAYVAMFWITPGRGVSLIYPGFGNGPLGARSFAGITTVHARRSNLETYQFAGSGFQSEFRQPQFLFMIASDRPLNLEQLGSYGMGLRRQLGVHFASISPYNTMERLAELALPSAVDDGSWTTDMYVYWPAVLHQRPGHNRVLMQCNGYAVYVPLELVSLAQAQLCGDPKKKEQTDQKSDSTEARSPLLRPEPRRPVPPKVSDREGLLDRITASSQLDRERFISRSIERRMGGPGAVDGLRPPMETIRRTPRAEGEGRSGPGAMPRVERPMVERPRVERPQAERPRVERPQVERPQPQPRVERPDPPAKKEGESGGTR